MNKLLSANFSRLFRSKIYWAGMLFMTGMALIAVFFRFYDCMSEPDYPFRTVDGLWFSGGMVIALVISVFVSVWIGTDYSDGTIRNKIIAGQTRCAIYFSNWITCTAASLMMHLSYIAVLGVFGSLLLEPAKIPLKVLAADILVSLLSVAVLSSVFVFTAMMIKTKSTGAIAAMLIAMVMIIGSITIQSMLSAPEMTENTFEMNIGGEIVKGEPIPNPRYLTGIKRDIYQFVLDVLPSGQMLQFTEKDVVPENTEYFVIYDLIVSGILSAVGCFLFNKKDLQ